MKIFFINIIFCVFLFGDEYSFFYANSYTQKDLVFDNSAQIFSDKSKKKTILLIGDSIMEGIFLGFKKLNLPPNLNVVSAAKQSTGLVNQKFFDWQNALENELKTLKGDVLVVVHFGPNDMLNAKINGQSVAFGDRKWREFYATQVQNIYKIVRKHKHEIAWLQTPCMKRDDLRKGMPILNEIYALAAKKNGANFINTNRFFCKNGDIILEKNIDKQQVKLRAKDGIHLSIAGAKIIAQKIIENY